jgi:hypothetical protein
MEICKRSAEMPYLPAFLQLRITGWGGIPRFFGSAFEMLMLSFDLTELQIFLSVACGGVMAGLCPSAFFSRRGRSKRVGAGARPDQARDGHDGSRFNH